MDRPGATVRWQLTRRWLAPLSEFADIRGVRSCLVFLVLAACELTPAPKQAPPTPAPAAPAVPAPEAAPASSCAEVAARVAEILIGEADLSERNALEQQRATTVQRLTETCAAQTWSADLRNCVVASKNKLDLQACETKFRPQPKAPDVIEPPKPAAAEAPVKVGGPPVPPSPEAAKPPTPKAGDRKAPKAGDRKAPKPPKAGERIQGDL
ncbi:MAG: hypothetical protein JWO36_4864 [Myxococcales bacterium]|nr:hypothetical protein [Myxococcales bacterium]